MTALDLNLEFTIITGLSGAGKSEAMNCFEDAGYFCIDNMPPSLLPKMSELLTQEGGKISHVAVVSDTRGGIYFDELLDSIAVIKAQKVACSIIFLEASREALIKRFKETRRRHPMAPSGSISEGIELEQKKLAALRGAADLVIDTSDLQVSQLKNLIDREALTDKKRDGLAISITSFGYKYGTPIDADLLMDVRFLPNPHYIPALQPLTGLDRPVKSFVNDSDVTKSFFRRYCKLLEFLIPHYIKEGKSHLTIGIGCTGGRHRSVAISSRLHDRLTRKGYHPSLRHRDISR